MSTTRERRQRRAERLREWADSNERKAAMASRASGAATAGIPFGQPVLVGHHSQRRHERALERAQSRAQRAYEHHVRAQEQRARADRIEAAAERAIYSDDTDAVERLRAKLAGLEAERAAVKRYHASCRKAAPGKCGDLGLLSEHLRAELLSVARVAAWQLGRGGAFPAYKLGNLGNTIRETKRRLAEMEREATGSTNPNQGTENE